MLISCQKLVVLPSYLKKFLHNLAEQVANEIKIPVIGIGAGNGVDGQVLVFHDMVGITHEFHPRFLRRYLNLYEDIKVCH